MSGAPVLYFSSRAADRSQVCDRLTRAGLHPTMVTDLRSALAAAATHPFSVCLVDLSEDRRGLASLASFRARHPQLPLAGLIDPESPTSAGEAMLAGVVDLLTWPFDERDVLTVMANARDRRQVNLSSPGDAAGRDTLYAQSPAMQHALDAARRAAAGRAPVLLCGEPGSGRQLVARALHAHAPGGAARPLVIVDCAGASLRDLERQLFGVVHDPRARRVNGAARERVARGSAVARARGGTLYLTALLEAPARVQTRIARLLRDGEALHAERRVVVDMDLRLVAAVEPDVDAAMADGRLHADIATRLHPVRVDVPPLRRRKEDLPLLAAHFLRKACVAESIDLKAFSRSALKLIEALPWPGNAVELKAVLERVVRSVDGPVIEIDDVLAHARLGARVPGLDTDLPLKDARARFERDCISAVLMRHRGKVGDAAKALGIERTNLYRKVRQLKVARSLLGARRAR